ncbi:MAG: FKBP-type peptidyl-prolyl cis-trans isomerase [Bacteroidales bacterium]|nr:FKBP-type peptidyl-prolyl cis-trans isomerase [Candidatus Colimorpha onthohippi]
MKNTVRLLTLLVVCSVLFAACHKSDIKGFKKTKSGLHYRFEKHDKGGNDYHVGDIVIGTLLVRLNNDTLFNAATPDRVMRITDSVYHDINISEGLLMMHVGDKATFAIFADSLAKYFTPKQMPPQYKAGNGQIFFYEIEAIDRVTIEEQEQEQAIFTANMEALRNAEPDSIQSYVTRNGITVAPNEDGLYIIVKRRGAGNKVALGKTVQINYTGKLLDGKIFDSNIESVAREADIYDAQRTYEPMKYEVGKQSLIQGWDKGVDGLPAGSSVTILMPSRMAYGAQGAGNAIPPYSPLVFDIDIVSVN